MINEEVRARMWEAYKAGWIENEVYSCKLNEEQLRPKFNEWLANPEHFPELMEPTRYKHFDIMCKCDEFTPLLKEKGCCCYD